MSLLENAIETLINTGAIPRPQPYTMGGDAGLIAPGQDPVLDLANPPPVTGNDRLQYPGIATGAPAPVAENTPVPVGVDRIGAERGEPDLTGVAGYDPNEPEFIPPETFARGDVAGAQSAESDQAARAGYAKYRADMAKLKAQQDTLTRQAQASERSAAEQQKADDDYKIARETAYAKVDAEQATWLQQVTTQAAKEPNPDRWFESRNNFGKAMWGLGLIFSSIHAGMTPGARNSVLEMVRQEINNDVQQQQARLDRELSTLKLKGELMGKRHQRLLSDTQDDHTMRLTRIQSLEKAWMARAAVPGDPAKAAAAMEAQAFFDELKLGVIGRRHETAVKQQDASLDRAHSARLKGMEIAQRQAEAAEQKRQFDDELDYKYWKEQADAEVRLATAKGAGEKLPEKRGVSFDTGLVLVGPDGNPVGDGTFYVRDEKTHQEVGEIATAGSELYKDLGALADLIENKSGVSAVGGVIVGEVNPEVAQLVTKIAYGNAKQLDPGGRLSEMDVLKGGVAKLGFTPDGKVLDRAKFAASKAEIAALIRRERENLAQGLSKKIAKYNDSSVNGQNTRVLYEPQRVTAPKIPDRNAFDDRPVTVEPPKTVKEYDERIKTEAAEPGLAKGLLPEHDRAAVEAVKHAVSGAGPETIRKKAAEALAKVKSPNPEDPWGENRPATPEEVRARTSAEETKRVIQMVADDAAAKAEKTLKQLEKDMASFVAYRKRMGMPELTLQDAQSLAKRKHMTNAGPEVVEIFERVKTAKQPKWKQALPPILSE